MNQQSLPNLSDKEWMEANFPTEKRDISISNEEYFEQVIDK